ncbi:MAG: glycosyltransferase [Lachnospiraceae bacterium]|nr:glycosyltransferase [Lachnospiraceae bacterium]
MSRLSIIIPTYNCEGYIRECLDPILDQCDGTCQLVLVDDGSNDGTPAVLEEYSYKYKNIIYSICCHRGVSATRNTGLDLANGDYITFIDCDDTLMGGFLRSGLGLLKSGYDLCIFGIRREVPGCPEELWTVEDRVYPSASDFADDYIRKRALLIYSNCNKFYQADIIRENGIRFREDVTFGEDRLFNYAYLPHCGRIATSSLIMLRYIQRVEDSQSTRYIPGYFDTMISLHREKMNCFRSLSIGTSQKEQDDFEKADLTNEVKIAIKRWEAHPEERDENQAEINKPRPKTGIY